MSQDIADMPGIESAMERFGTLEVSSATPAAPADKIPDTREPRPADAPPAVAEATPPTHLSDAQNSDSKSTDTRAASEQATAANNESKEVKTPDGRPAEATKPDEAATPVKSRYAKSQERLARTWDQVNADKSALATERARLEADRADMARQRAEFDVLQQQAQQPQFKPEDYQAASRQKKALADHQRAEARRLEDAGKSNEAATLAKQADRNDALSEDLADHAENLRKHPPATFQQRAAQLEQARKAWTVEAARQYPELVKEGSNFQRRVAEHLQGLTANDPQLAAHPAAVFHASRLTHFELRAQALESEAARVPVLMKEAESLRARIKELEALTAPAGEGGVARLGAEAPADDYAALRHAAAEGGSLFR